MRTIILLLAVSNVFAVTLPTTLPELTQHSTCIIVGKVEAIRETDDKGDYELPVFKARVVVETTLKGHDIKVIEVAFIPRLSISTELKKGQKYVMFLRQGQYGLQPVLGQRGVIEVNNGKASTGYLPGEGVEQNLDKFLVRVERLLFK